MMEAKPMAEPVPVEPTVTRACDVVRRAKEAAQRYLDLADDNVAVEKGRAILEKVEGFEKGEVPLNELEELLVECDRPSSEPTEAAEAPERVPSPVGNGANANEVPAEPKPILPRQEEVPPAPVPQEQAFPVVPQEEFPPAIPQEEVPPPASPDPEPVANEAPSPQQEQVDGQQDEEQAEGGQEGEAHEEAEAQDITDSFDRDDDLIAAAEPVERRQTPPPEPRDIPEHMFNDIRDYNTTPCDQLHNHNLKYVNVLGQVVSVFKTQKGVIVLRFWDGKILKYEKLTNLKAFRAEPSFIESYIAPATPELDEIPLDYCMDICVYGEWINMAEKLKSGDIICIVNLHLWLPKAQRSITPTLHQGGQGRPFYRNIWLISPEDAAADQINRELAVTAVDLKSNNRTNGEDQPRPAKKPESTVPLSLQKKYAAPTETRRDATTDPAERPGPSRVSVAPRQAEVVVEKVVRAPSLQLIQKEQEETTKRSEKEVVVRNEEPIPSTSKETRMVVLPEEQPQPVVIPPKKTSPPKKKKKVEHWSKNVVVDDEDIDEMFAGLVACPQSTPKFVYPVVDPHDEMDDIEEPGESVVVIQRPSPVERTEKAVQTVFRSKTVATQCTAPKKSIGLQAAIAEERPATKSFAMQTSPEKAPSRPQARSDLAIVSVKQEVVSPARSQRGKAIAPASAPPPPLPPRRNVNLPSDPTPSRVSANPKTSSTTPSKRKNPHPPKPQMSAPRERAPAPPRRTIIPVAEPIPPRRLSSLRSAASSKTSSPQASIPTPPRPPKRTAAINVTEEPPIPPKRSKETPVAHLPAQVKEEVTKPRPPKRSVAPPVPPRKQTKEAAAPVARSPAKEKPASRRSLRVAHQEQKPLASKKELAPPTSTAAAKKTNEQKITVSSKICKAPQARFIPPMTEKSGRPFTGARK